MVAIFRKTWARWWGRTEDVLRAPVLTLLYQRDATMCEIPLLLEQPGAWHHMLDRVDDPVGLGPWWDHYLEATQAQRMQMVGSLLYKLRAILLRRRAGWGPSSPLGSCSCPHSSRRGSS